MPLQDSASNLLLLLAKIHETRPESDEIDGATLQKITNLPTHEINDAIALLQNSGYVEWRQYLGTAPYNFGSVRITPVGRYEAERVSSIFADPVTFSTAREQKAAENGARLRLPATPIGSPYGFHDQDWEVIADRKNRPDQLFVVMGYQFKSDHYDPNLLQANVQASFSRAVQEYNGQPGAIPTTLNFHPLAAGYGEHLFNEIARDIIAADIAVFETSDLNPNVMLELGVALTWGTRVLPIKLHSRPAPPSDISGQTWADYDDNAARFIDPDHERKLIRMVDRAMRKKGLG